MILSGRLADWSVADLLQILRITEKTASLEIEGGDRSGTLFFENGRIVDAELSPGASLSSARERAVEAVYVLQLLGDGSFAVGTRTPATSDGERFDPGEVLSAAERFMAAEAELGDSGFAEAPALGLATDVPDELGISESQWAVIAELVGTFSLGELELRVGRARSVDFVAGLHRMGLVRAAEVASEEIADVSADSPTLSELVDAFEREPQHEAEAGSSTEAVEVIELEQLDTPPDAPAPADSPTESLPKLDADAASAIAEIDELANGHHERRKEMRALISPSDTTLVPGVLDDLRTRFRNAEH